MTEKEYIERLKKLNSDVGGDCIPYEGNEHLLGTTDSPEE